MLKEFLSDSTSTFHSEVNKLIGPVVSYGLRLCNDACGNRIPFFKPSGSVNIFNSRIKCGDHGNLLRRTRYRVTDRILDGR